MELKKTTILSAFVVVAGLIAEIMFRDVLTKTVSGMVIGLVLAVIVFVAFYFTIDGLYILWNREREQSKKHQKDLEQKLYSILTEQLKFQKIIYNEVHQLAQQGMGHADRTESLFDVSAADPQQVTAAISDAEIEKIIAAVNAHTEKFTQDLEEMVIDISDHTMQTAKEIEQAVTTINAHTTEMTQGMESAAAAGALSAETQTVDIAKEMEYVVDSVKANTEEAVQDLKEMVASMQGQPQMPDMGEVVSQINDHTMQTAKVVAKYIGKTSEEIKKKLDENQNSLLHVVGS